MAIRKRFDPAARPADGRTNFDRIGGKDPDRHYVLCNPNDEATGLAHYVHELGYEVETVRKGGPTTAASRNATDGAKVTSGGLVLVSCPREDYEAREAVGQHVAGELEGRILKDGGAVMDAMRGRGVEMSARLSRDTNVFAGEDA